jgi:hypothetical protein
VTKYRKRPVVISAVQWNGDNELDLHDALLAPGQRVPWLMRADDILVQTKDGWVRVAKGEWICRGTDGEFFLCADDVFQNTYEVLQKDHGQQ